jgi:WD40 repeat protein
MSRSVSLTTYGVVVTSLFLTLVLSSCATPQSRDLAGVPNYWGIVPLTFGQVIDEPSDYSTEKGRSLRIRYEKNLENIFMSVRKTYKVGEIEFVPYVSSAKVSGLSFLKPTESRGDERFVTLTVVASSSYFVKPQSTYYERASVIFTKYVRSLMEIALQETGVINDPDVSGVWIFISWSTVNKQPSERVADVTKRGEGLVVIAAKNDCKKFVDSVLSPQDFASKSSMFGIQEGNDLGAISLNISPDMKNVDMVDKRIVAMMWYAEGIRLNYLDREVAISAFDRAIETDSDLSEAYYNRGSDYTILDMQDLAIKDIEEAIGRAPKGPEEYYMKAALSALNNKPEESCSFIKKAIAVGLKTDVNMTRIQGDANFSGIREAPCYKEIVPMSTTKARKTTRLKNLMVNSQNSHLIGEATPDSGGIVKFWSLADGRLEQEIPLTARGHRDWSSSLALSPDGNNIAVTWLKSKGIGCYSIKENRWMWKKKLEGDIVDRSIQFTADSNRLIVLGWQGILTYDARTGDILKKQESLPGIGDGYSCLSSTARYAAVWGPRLGHDDDFLLPFSFLGAKWIHVFNVEQEKNVMDAAGLLKRYKNCGGAFTPDDGYVAIGSMDGIVRVLSINEEKVVKEWRAYGEDSISLRGSATPNHIDSLVFSRDGRFLATMGYEKGFVIKVWDYAGSKLLQTFEKVTDSGMLCGNYPMIFTPDGEFFAFSQGGRLCLYATTTWTEKWCVNTHTDKKTDN